MMEKNCISRRAALGAAIGAFALAAVANSAQAEWRGWNIHVEGYPNTVAMDSMADMLAEKSGGEITLKMFHAGVLGSQPDAIEQVRLGALEIGNFNLGPMGQVVPETNVVSLPFVFKDMEHMYRVMDGEVGEEIGAAMAAKGLTALAWYSSGARSFYNSKRPITQPSDVEGLKVRVMNNDLFVGMIESLGGNATPMAFSEVFQSIKTGVVDGAENNWPSFESTSHFEVAGYYSLSQHLIIPECVCINTGVYEGLSAEQQQLVKDAARASAKEQRKLWDARAESSREKVLAAGVQFNEIADKTPFQEAMNAVYEKAYADNPSLKPLVEKIRAVD